MTNPIPTRMRRKLAALLATPLLLAAASADRVAYRDTYYSSASQTTIVGKGVGYCDGDYIIVSGYATSYYTTVYAPPCP
ncbi:hypothetical protein [Longimicrobium sp.]|uniref:hypothetical protein n=1 Tax=Longimicrobium sp. TaxID=2029185 RepID=UPI002E380289|nr:hypothetical protein [Longimicrobium sp.]HEX6037222.1 hypothetical protein [Longimicrobium sp.]